MLRAARWHNIVLIAASVLAGCTNLESSDALNPTTAISVVPPSAGSMQWLLPKTVLDVSVTYMYVSCVLDAEKLPQVSADVAVTVTPRTVPDSNLFVNRPGGVVNVKISATQSFWEDRKLTMSRYSSGIVKSLGADVANQTGTIISNVLSFAAKAAAIGFGVPGGGKLAAPVGCGAAPARVVGEIAALKRRLVDPSLSDTQVKKLSAMLQASEHRITIKMDKVIVDPGVTAPVPPSGVVASILPTESQMQKAGWYTGAPGEQKGLQVQVILDFVHATPLQITTCPDNQTTCEHRPVHITDDTQYREVANIPVQVRRGVPPGTTEQLSVNGGEGAGTVAFGQFGIPRALPISAGIFQKYDWTIGFQENGAVSDESFGSGAWGPNATAAWAGAASTGNTIAGQARNAADADFAAQQAQDAQEKVQLDLIDRKPKIDQLKATGQWPY